MFISKNLIKESIFYFNFQNVRLSVMNVCTIHIGFRFMRIEYLLDLSFLNEFRLTAILFVMSSYTKNSLIMNS